MGAPSADFIDRVKNALEHLHDFAYLREDHLGSMLLPERLPFGVSRAQAMRQLLLDAIERLNVGHATSMAARRDRTYRILELRYVEALPYREVMTELGLSQSQYHRDQHRAVEAVAGLLWDLYIPPDAPSAGSPVSGGADSRYSELEAVAHTSETLVDLTEVLRGVAEVIRSVAEKRRVTLHVHPPPKTLAIASNRTLLRQLLITVAEYVLQAARTGTLASGTLAFGATMKSRNLVLRLEYCGPIVVSELQTAPQRERETLIGQFAQALGGIWQIDQQRTRFVATVTLRNRHRLLLAIDDNPDFVQLVTRYVADQDYTVMSAGSLDDGMRLAEAVHPDVLLLDVMLPERDGWDALQALRHHPATQDIPIVMCTALGVADLALALGAAAFLRKPVTREALLEALHCVTASPPLPAASGRGQSAGGEQVPLLRTRDH